MFLKSRKNFSISFERFALKPIYKNQNFKNHQAEISELIWSKNFLLSSSYPGLIGMTPEMLTEHFSTYYPSLYLHTAGQNGLLNACSFRTFRTKWWLLYTGFNVLIQLMVRQNAILIPCMGVLLSHKQSNNDFIKI